MKNAVSVTAAAAVDTAPAAVDGFFFLSFVIIFECWTLQ